MVRGQLTAALLVALLSATATLAHGANDLPPELVPADGRFHPAYVRVKQQPEVPRAAVETPATAREPVSDSPQPRRPHPAAPTGDAGADPVLLPDNPVPGLGPTLWKGDPADLPAPPPITTVPAAYRPGPVEVERPGMLLLSPAEDDEWIEGRPVTIRWLSSGPIQKVRIYYSYERCRLAGVSRGNAGVVLADMIPNRNQFTWSQVPWLDTASLRLRIAGYDGLGNRVATDERGVRFRPRELTDIPDTCIAIVKKRQRLYYYRDGRIVRMHIISTAAPGYSTPSMRPGSHDPRRGAMGKVFSKNASAWSRRYNCAMPYWMAITASGSHGIHATSPRYYGRLGSPASHGCVRQHRTDAGILFGMVPVGTKVYIF